MHSVLGSMVSSIRCLRKNYDYLVAQEQKEGSRGQKTRLERSLGFAFNLNDYPGAIKLYLHLIYFFIHLFNLFCEKTIINCICTGWIANNNIIIHDS